MMRALALVLPVDVIGHAVISDKAIYCPEYCEGANE